MNRGKARIAKVILLWLRFGFHALFHALLACSGLHVDLAVHAKLSMKLLMKLLMLAEVLTGSHHVVGDAVSYAPITYSV